MGTSAGDADFLQAALLGYEQQRTEIETRIAELRRQLGRRGAADGATELPDAGAAQPGQRRALSAVARKRIADGQRKRWAAFRKESAPAQTKAVPAAKRKISAAAKKRIGDAARKRWAAFRAKKASAVAPSKVRTAGA